MSEVKLVSALNTTTKGEEGEEVKNTATGKKREIQTGFARQGSSDHNVGQNGHCHPNFANVYGKYLMRKSSKKKRVGKDIPPASTSNLSCNGVFSGSDSSSNVISRPCSVFLPTHVHKNCPLPSAT